MKETKQIHWLFLILLSLASCNGQNRTDQIEKRDNQVQNGSDLIPNLVKVDTVQVKNAPNHISRTIIQDKAGNIWFATFGGIFKYDGTSFTNISKKVSQSRFFSILEDSTGNLWFGSIGSGVYSYDGKSFRNFTTKDGLVNNEIVCIYEDKIGCIWFGANGGVSMYDGKLFRNYLMSGDSIMEDPTSTNILESTHPPNEVSSIMEDQTGELWFGTRGNTFIYDGYSFTTVRHDGQPFNNVRSIIEDQKGNIWLGGNAGLWCYDRTTFTNYAEYFVGSIYEDTQGNIWTSSSGAVGWSLSRYDLTDSHKVSETATKIKSGEGMFFGILEDSDGNIWTGTLNGVCRYNGNTFTYFRR